MSPTQKRPRQGKAPRSPQHGVGSIKVTVKGEAWFQELAHKIFTESEEEADRRSASPDRLLDEREHKLVADGMNALLRPEKAKETRRPRKRRASKRS
jgi:hypothetical protein